MPAGQDEIASLGSSPAGAPGTGSRTGSDVEVGAAGAAAAAGGLRTLKEVLKAAREETAIMGLATARAAAGLAKPEARRKHVRQIMLATFFIGCPGEIRRMCCGNRRGISAAGKEDRKTEGGSVDGGRRGRSHFHGCGMVKWKGAGREWTFARAWGDDGHGMRAERSNWRGGTGAKNFYGGRKIPLGQF